MATTPVDVIIGVDGQLGLVLKLYPIGSDTIANGTGDELTERQDRPGVYRAVVAETISGVHEAYVIDSDGDIFWHGFLYLEDTESVWSSADDLASVMIGTRGEALSDIPWNEEWDAQVQAKCGRH